MANQVVYFEIMGPDGPGLRDFYSKVFDWHTNTYEGLNDYEVTDPEKTGIPGGVGKAQRGDAEAYMAVYVRVPDVEVSLELAASEGGTVTHQKTSIPSGPTYALFRDPAGNVVGLVEGE